MKKLFITLSILGISIFLLLIFFISAFSIQDTTPEDCTIKNTEIVRITEGTSYDIMFYEQDQTFFYINRGLEQGLNLDSLRSKVLNKTVTLHLAKLPTGTSNHISQLTVGEEVLFTEFD